MELHIKSEFDCVYTVNGEFYERADSLTMSEFEVVYITVFPLKHTLLPYTIKLNGAENIRNELACGIRLSPEHYLLSLAPRYIIVYGTASASQPPAKTHIARLFSFIKNGDIAAAYSMLTDELRANIDKATLSSFFSGYERLAECDWESGNKFYLIDKSGVAKLHTYTLKNEFIDDIAECD
ncbi:MAG: hypothetical protein J1G01_06200 [Clostridiales bacterium]|nr:hypothetical protein [Clostridiales bacterium]